MDSTTCPHYPKGQIYTSDEAGVIKCFDVETNKEICNLGIVHDGQILATASSNDGKFFVTSDNQGNIKLFDGLKSTFLHDFGIAHDGSIEALVFDKSNHFFYSGGSNGKLKKWSANKRKLKTDYGQAHGNATILSLAINRDVLFSGDGVGRLQVWLIDKLEHKQKENFIKKVPQQIRENQKILPQKDIGLKHAGGIEAMQISPNGNILFSCDSYGFVKQWGIREAIKGEVYLEKNYGSIMSGCISAICCSPDNNFLYITNDLGNMKKIDVEKKRCSESFGKVMDNWINSLCINSKGNKIWLTDSDGKMNCWDTKKNEICYDFQKIHKRTIHSVSIVENI